MTNQISGTFRLNALLSQLNEDGNFPISILTDQQGLAIASASSNGFDSDRQSAVVAYIQKTAITVAKQLEMSQASEFSLSDEHGQKLVCRPFSIDGSELILSVMIPNRSQSYKKVTNTAIREIRRTWKTLWE